MYIYIHTYVHACILCVQCLGEGKNFFFDLSKAIVFCKNSFLGSLYKKIAVVLRDTPYYHTPFYIGVEVLQAAALL